MSRSRSIRVLRIAYGFRLWAEREDGVVRRVHAPNCLHADLEVTSAYLLIHGGAEGADEVADDAAARDHVPMDARNNPEAKETAPQSWREMLETTTGVVSPPPPRRDKDKANLKQLPWPGHDQETTTPAPGTLPTVQPPKESASPRAESAPEMGQATPVAPSSSPPPLVAYAPIPPASAESSRVHITETAMRLIERTGQDYVTPDVRQKITDFARKGGMQSDSPIQVELVRTTPPPTQSQQPSVN